ncbi:MULTISPECIES: phosphate ABC transporter permease subunit PstC [Paenibacillus]|uniref:Phosphate transport system permease protein n=2 Tax=Paenibacillus TaxID=44249 RepID=A0A7Y6EUY9_9BACL|nr:MULTISPECIES: phosphate ABC transporter permease subunit PstC [Paenibacillus]KGP77516.1 phosphate ABC transporter permease [Paenibacillus sp. MAEPY2]KGP79277.1 phosphate ABC transporter permease [Paenibacillus sp. MAEPY1]MDN4605375.1 phosphate ABC transporter permease subunit PstC [Paenibacillus vandeheii]NUU75263.1 phosphate ABC transporter permease subunit PstC [Paenibacillus xylanilyticus]
MNTIPQGNHPFRSNQVRYADYVMPFLLFLCALVSILTTIGIVYTLVSESIAFFKQVPILEFLTGTTWAPLIQPVSFGVVPLMFGTLMVTLIACCIAIPVGLATAIYLSEYATLRVRNIVKPVLEVLAGVPTIVYGYFALSFITPVIQTLIPGTSLFNALSAGIAVGVMIIPMVSSLSEDAMRAVPSSLRYGAYALGATRFEVAVQVVLPAALSGIISSFVLAFSRAIGETMIVTVAAGATPQLTANPLDSIQTMTAYIVQVSLGDTPHGSLAYGSIFAVGLTLFVITLILNIIAAAVSKRYREVY